MKNSFLIFLLLCGACIKPETPPADVIPKDTMVRILTDIHIAEAKVANMPLPLDSSYLYYGKYKMEIYSKYGIGPERFDRSFDYYVRNLKEMDKIYEVVVDSLSLMEGRGILK